MANHWQIRNILRQVEDAVKPTVIIPFRNQGMAALRHFDLTGDTRAFLAELGIVSPSALETSIDGYEAANPT